MSFKKHAIFNLFREEQRRNCRKNLFHAVVGKISKHCRNNYCIVFPVLAALTVDPQNVQCFKEYQKNIPKKSQLNQFKCGKLYTCHNAYKSRKLPSPKNK